MKLEAITIHFYKKVNKFISYYCTLGRYPQDGRLYWQPKFVGLMEQELGTIIENSKNYDLPILYCGKLGIHPDDCIFDPEEYKSAWEKIDWDAESLTNLMRKKLSENHS